MQKARRLLDGVISTMFEASDEQESDKDSDEKKSSEESDETKSSAHSEEKKSFEK